MAAIAAGAAVMDCAGEQPEIKYARGYVRGPHRVSVLGVFKDGRMDTAAWDQLGPKVADALDGPCEPGYGEHLRSAEPRLFQSIEEQAEQDGVTPTLLDQLAGRTDAELILVLYEYGAPPRPAGSSSAAAPKPPAPASTPSLRGRGRGSRGGRRAGGGSPPRGAAPEADFELAASLFDVNEHAFVAEVDVKKAKTADAAIDQLVNSFDSLLSGSSCAIFDWDKQ
jgi:hypothetical protein